MVNIPDGATHYRKILCWVSYHKPTDYNSELWLSYRDGDWYPVFGKPWFSKPIE